MLVGVGVAVAVDGHVQESGTGDQEAYEIYSKTTSPGSQGPRTPVEIRTLVETPTQ